MQRETDQHLRDDWAQRAAARMCRDMGISVHEAICQCQPRGNVQCQAPTETLVLRHLEAIEEVALGESGANQRHAEVARRILETLELIEVLTRPDVVQVAGRIAAGHFSGPIRVQARVCGGMLATAQEIAQTLEDSGVNQVKLSVANTRAGAFDRLEFAEGNLGYVVLLCPAMADQGVRFRANLYTGEPVELVSLKAFGRLYG